MVEEVYAPYTDEFRVYVFDRRENLPEVYSLEDMAEDTSAVMKELGLANVNMFGASLGGMIAMIIAMEHPELVKKLILASTSSHVRPEHQGVIDKWLTLAANKDKLGLCTSYAQEIYPEAIYEQNKAYFEGMAGDVTDEELERFIKIGSSMKGFDVTDRLKKIKCPVYVTGAYEDKVLDDDATMEIAENLDHMPDFRLYLHTGYGHAAFDTAPDYMQKMLDFLRS